MIRFSDDYKGPGFGFLTKAREYDKWAHFAGSAAMVLLCVGFLRLIGIPGLFVYTIGAWLSALIVFGLGLGLEIWQGVQRYYYETDPTYFTGSSGPTDGFSFLDLIANAAGILLAVGVIV